MDKQLLKVLMIADLPEDHTQIKGGVESAVLNLLTGLSELKINVQVVNFPSNVKHQTTSKLSENISLRYLPNGIIKNYLYDYLIHGRRAIKKIINTYQPDIIHIQGTGPQLMLLKHTGFKNIIITQHGIMREEKKYQIGLKKSLRFLLKSIIETVYLPRIRNIILISEYNKIFLSSKLLTNSVKIPNAINNKYFKINRSENFLNKIIYIGAINKRKGLINILKALHLLKKRNMIFNLDIIGGFIDRVYEESIKNYINSHSIQGNVQFYGWQPPDSITKIMQDNSLFVLSSYQETLPVSIAEAMAAGLVVLANDVGGVNEMFLDKHSGFLFKNNDINELVQILEKLYNNSTLISEISKNARSHAKQHYHPEVVAKQTLDFYTKVSNYPKNITTING